MESGATERQKNLGRPTCIWGDNIEINIIKIVWVWTGVIWFLNNILEDMYQMGNMKINPIYIE
jgi:hypothetical protein